MKQRSWKINEQGPDGEEVSHEEQQYQADIESKEMAAKQQKATESRKEVQMVSEGSIFQKQQQKERARSHKQHEATLETLCIQDQS